jgi:hypothetical protein
LVLGFCSNSCGLKISLCDSTFKECDRGGKSRDKCLGMNGPHFSGKRDQGGRCHAQALKAIERCTKQTPLCQGLHQPL